MKLLRLRQSCDKGTAFVLAPGGNERIIHGGKDGAVPEAGLVMDGQGNLYGTTSQGGGSGCQSEGCGTVFELTAAGTEMVLYRFAGGSDGLGPTANLIFDGQGNLYGTTVRGGDFDWGTVFELTPGGTETVLYSFSGGTDGGYPATGLIIDSQGKLYGTTEFGGSAAAPGGFGIVFQISQ